MVPVGVGNIVVRPVGVRLTVGVGLTLGVELTPGVVDFLVFVLVFFVVVSFALPLSLALLFSLALLVISGAVGVVVATVKVETVTSVGPTLLGKGTHTGSWPSRGTQVYPGGQDVGSLYPTSPPGCHLDLFYAKYSHG